jgi:hypothetical protein
MLIEKTLEAKELLKMTNVALTTDRDLLTEAEYGIITIACQEMEKSIVQDDWQIITQKITATRKIIEPFINKRMQHYAEKMLKGTNIESLSQLFATKEG